MLSPNAQEFVPHPNSNASNKPNDMVSIPPNLHQQLLPPPPPLPPSTMTYYFVNDPTATMHTLASISGAASPIVPSMSPYCLSNYYYHTQLNTLLPNTTAQVTAGSNQQQPVTNSQYSHYVSQGASGQITPIQVASEQNKPVYIQAAYATQAALPLNFSYQMSPIVPAYSRANMQQQLLPPPVINYQAAFEQNIEKHKNKNYKNYSNKNVKSPIEPMHPQSLHMAMHQPPPINNNQANNMHNDYSNANKIEAQYSAVNHIGNQINGKKTFGPSFKGSNNYQPFPNKNNNMNMNNNKKKNTPNNSNHSKKMKPMQFLDEQDWPSLSNCDSPGEESNDKPIEVTKSVNKYSSLKNVNLFKYTIQQHYINETSRNDKNSENSKLSFKEVVLTKKTLVTPSAATQVTLSSLATGTTSQEGLAEKNEKSAVNIAEKELVEVKRKSNRKRRGKRGSRGGQKGKTTGDKVDDDEEDEDKDDENYENFDLTVENFPALSLETATKSNKSSAQNDPYYNDDATTLDTNTKRCQNTLVKKILVKQATSALSNITNSSKKQRQPITFEFATIFSALEKGEQKEKPKYKNKFSLSTMTNRHMQNLVRPKLSSVSVAGKKVNIANPLNSTLVFKKGKERETPKKKKPSTLKKIILKEREEKKQIKDQNFQLDQLSIGGNEIASSLVGLANDSISAKDAIILSPRGDSTSLDLVLIEKQPSESAESGNNVKKAEKVDEENTEIMSNNMSPISQNSPISESGYSMQSPYTLLKNLDNDGMLSLLSLEKLELLVKEKIHSRKFREYCNQIINKDIDELCVALLHEIVRFQDRLYHKNPTKAKAKRRYVMGIREVTKHLKLAKLKCIILAPNCEKIQSKGGLDDAINSIIKVCMEQNVPFLFALGRKSLGKALNKLVPISVVGIFDYSGVEEYFKKLVDLANNAKLTYQNMVEEYEKEECENLISGQSSVYSHNNLATINDIEVTENYTASNTNGFLYNNNIVTNPRIPSHMGHSRNASNGSSISTEPLGYHMNYHTHSRSASGTFNYGHTTSSLGGHSRSASGGGTQTINLDFGIHSNMHWSHSRTPSNCSNISIISRLSEPVSEVGGSNLMLNANSKLPGVVSNSSAYAAMQFYAEQVRNEMREGDNALASMTPKTVVTSDNEEKKSEITDQATAVSDTKENMTTSLTNLHLTRISELDAGNEVA